MIGLAPIRSAGGASFQLGRSARRLPIATILVILCFSACGLSAANGAEGDPYWRVLAQTDSFFTPGTPASEGIPSYLIRFQNIGASPTDGPYTFTVILPSGISIPTTGEPRFENEQPTSLACQILEGSSVTVTCTGEEPLSPGRVLRLNVPVVLESAIPSPLVTSVYAEGGGAPSASTTVSTPVADNQVGFEFLPSPEGVASLLTGSAGQELLQAGTAPTQDIVSAKFAWPRRTETEELSRLPEGGLKTLEINLPKGVVVDPDATPVKCSEAQLEAESCPRASQVGTVQIPNELFKNPLLFHRALYNMKPPPGVPAELAFEPLNGLYIHALGKVRSDGDFGLSAVVTNVPATVGVFGAEAELWGVPTSPIHDGNRAGCIQNLGVCSLEPDERTGVPFVTTPTSCGNPLVSSASAVSYGSSAPIFGASSTPPMAGCGLLGFAPSISLQLTTATADSPTGLSFDLHQPQNSGSAESGEGASLSTASLKDAKVALPEGITLNPSAANGLSSCSGAQIGLKTPVGQASPAHFDETLGGCPSASKLGTVEVDTPLLENPLVGSVYLAKPFDNPFGSLLAIYLAIEDTKSGVVAKLPGLVEPDARTGQLTVSFSENPELPIEDVKLRLFEGSRSPLTTPLSCGVHTTASDLAPWTTPEGADAHPIDSFSVGSGCSASESAAPKSVSFSAGTISPLAGSYSPFSIRFSRPDGSQRITGIETTLPEGLLGKLAGVAYCPESDIAKAKGREAPEMGTLEQASPSCPASSQIGTVNITAGAGSTPLPVSGNAYLAGPYKGAPLSLVVIVPAVAGPFDLGTVVDRVALNVGEYDARIHAIADPLPTILDGIPLDIRSVEIKLKRPGFTLNPTSCEAKQVEGSITTQPGQTQMVTNRFQVGDCERLAFKPSLKISLRGATGRTGHPALKAVLTYPRQGEYANIRRAQVSLPHSEFLDQSNIGKACTRPALAAHACPTKSIYGKAEAWSPLLEQPLEGPVYLVGGYGYKLPALVAELDGQIRVMLAGKVDSGPHKGIRNTFEAVPDAPITRFVLELKGGRKYGLLENSEDICRKKQVAGVALRAQNGRRKIMRIRVANGCQREGGVPAHATDRSSRGRLH